MINIFKKRKNNNFKLNDFFLMHQYVWEMYSALGLTDVSHTHHKNYFVAIKNSNKLESREDLKKKPIYINMVELGLMVEIEVNNFAVTTRGLNILQGFLLKEIKTDNIKIFKAPQIL